MHDADEEGPELDLRTYIEAEIDEDRELAQGGSRVAALVSVDDYPGDGDAYVPEADVSVERTRLAGSGVDQELYVARPESGGRAPGVVVIHENKGLVPYARKRRAPAGAARYIAVAPDLLSRAGGTRSYERASEATEALSRINGDLVVADVRAVITHLAERDDVVSDRLAIVAFCYDGGVAWRVLKQDTRLAAAGVPFYGPIPALDAVPGIQAPVLAVYSALDSRSPPCSPRSRTR